MNIEKKINGRIKKYGENGQINQTARLFLSLSEIKHYEVKKHCERVALLSEKVAQLAEKDAKAAFWGGFFHDIGKLILPAELFDGHNISSEEYGEIKSHVKNGYEILKEIHLFIALCAGLHHGIYKSGYGLKPKDIPKGLSFETLKKVLEIATIISICDFIDAFTHRKTKIMDGSDKKSSNLFRILKEKYPNDHTIVKIAIKVNKELKLD